MNRVSGGDELFSLIEEMVGGDGCTTLQMNLMPLNCPLRDHWKGKVYNLNVATEETEWQDVHLFKNSPPAASVFSSLLG